MVGGFGLGRRRQHGELRALLNELGAGGKLGRSADEVALRRIDALIDQYDAGNAVAPEDTTGTGRLVARAGLCLGAYQETGDVRFLNSTIALSAQAATAAVKGSRLGAESLGNLSLGLRLLVAHTPDDWVLEAAVRTGRAAIDAFPQGDQRVHATIDLSATLNQLANRSDGVAILDESISLGRQAKAALRSASPLRFIALTHLGAALQLHHRRTGNRGTLDEAVDVLREAASLAPPARDRQGAACLSSYATALLNKAQLDHDVALFEEAVTLLRQCLS